MITVSNLSKTYKMGEVKTVALRQVSLTIQKGEFVAIMGKSGCGKSTLMNILGGMDTQTDGEYLFDNINVSRLRGAQLAHFRGTNIGYVFQGFHLINEMNASENIAMPMGYAGVSTKIQKERIIELLARVGLADKAKSRPQHLSGGEQQRIAIARALANCPQVLLADEPTGNLDEENSNKILTLLEELNNSGITVIMVTHDKDMAQRAKRIITLSDGKIVEL